MQCITIGDLPPVMLALMPWRSFGGSWRDGTLSPTDSALVLDSLWRTVLRDGEVLAAVEIPDLHPKTMPRPTRSVNGVSWISVLYRVPLHSG